jgi:S-adenosylmethionine:tRNA ribosyltransferase-isomerase
LSPHDLLVVNRTRVIPARLYARKPTGAAIEVFLLRPALHGRKGDWEALVSPARRVKGALPLRLALEPSGSVDVREGLGEGRFLISFAGTGPFRRFLLRSGHVPLPPYIRRPDNPADKVRYQTVFARKDGSVAAPTAGLHFTPRLLSGLKARGVARAEVVLHVGLGTFLPMDEGDTGAHRMHSERFEVPGSSVRAIARTRAAGGRVVAVGTTVCRALEAASEGGDLRAAQGETRIFIRPGHRFRAVDALFTNLHQPRSTLLMLVCAFAGRERVMAAYGEALRKGYRFLSYGDAMLIL